MKSACFVALAAVLAVTLAQEDTVKTKSGVIVGKVHSNYRVFRGVPYAAPPVGPLRFASPQAPQPWTTPFQAFNDAPGCPQNCNLPPHTCPPVQSEDCLKMNIFTPRAAKETEPLPVMYWIHGGNFRQGYIGGLLYNGSTLASQHNVIVVTVQYRLGGLGFLYTGDSIMGNYGLEDQRFGMQWVQDNIAAFGGDPNSITLFGQSAGAMSIASHISSPTSKGKFQRAILESEPFGIPFRTPDTWPGLVKGVAKDLQCGDDVDACLKAAPVDKFLAAQDQAEKNLLIELTHILERFVPWTPTVGTAQMPLQNSEAWTSGEAHDVPIIIGTVLNEGIEFVFEGFPKSLPKLELDVVIDAVYGFGHEKAIYDQYPISSTGDTRVNASRMVTDSLFVCASRNATISGPVARNSPAFVYHFDHVMSFSQAAWGANFSFCDDKVCHAEELVFVFGSQNKELGFTFSADEVQLSASMQFYWSNFAATGNPNTPPSRNTHLRVGDFPTWPMVGDNEGELKFMTPANVVETAPFKQTCALWDAIGKYPFP